MNRNCDFIMDLLPLYAENLASKATGKLVEEHLKTCENCAAMLGQMREEMVFPLRTDITMLENYKRNRIKRNILAACTVVLLLLVVAHGLLIGCTVPIWLRAEEAIESVEEVAAGSLLVTLSDDVERDGVFGSDNLFITGLRLSFRDKEDYHQAAGANTRAVFGVSALWYIGTPAGEENTLLWGDQDTQPEKIPFDETLAYVFNGALILGLLCAVPAMIPWRGKKAFGIAAALALCAAASCWFVCAGRFAVYPVYDYALEMSGRMGMLTQRLIHTGVMTALLFWGILSAYGWAKLTFFRKRGVGDESGL